MSDLGRTELEQGREAYRRRAWIDALEIFLRIDRETSLGAEDLERLAMSAYLANRDDDCLRALERCHQAYLEQGECLRAVRAAFWLSFRLSMRGEMGPATGWSARAERLMESEAAEAAERGYLLVLTVERQLAEGDWQGAFETARSEAGIAERFHDRDLLACALHQQGRVLLRKCEVAAGLAFLDEAMVAVVAGEVSPLMTGLIYCSVIMACREVHALDRAREWTSRLGRWCDDQPQVVAFTGSCLVHRAEIMQLGGAWGDAIEEAGRACERFSTGIDPQPPAPAFYQRAEIHRLRGAFAAAETDYRRASQYGCEPQPGLALLRLVQGHKTAAEAAMRRVMGATTDPLRRARLLPAQVEIALAVGDADEAARACGELEEVAAAIGRRPLEAIAAQARGSVLLGENDAAGALVSLRRSLEVWQAIAAPYETARVRVLTGLACRALGDADGAELELAAARDVFEVLGARPDIARVDAIMARRQQRKVHGLTPREAQVLCLVSAGKTNKAIAAELCLSERTVERHLSNIFTKLDLSTRAAATAWAHRHGLV